MSPPIQVPVENIFSKFFHLTSQEKMLFFEAWIFLGWYRLQIRLVSFKKISHTFARPHHHHHHHHTSSNTTTPLTTITLISNAISRAAKYTPWKSACLVQALVARRMLHRRQVAGILYLGVKIDREQTKPNLAAHAWSKCDDIFITGQANHKKYRVIELYHWGSR